MAELPYMQFFPADWLADCNVLSMSSRGAWQTFLCKAWQARSASVSLKIAQWSRVFGATNVEQAERAIAEIEECEIGDVIRDEDGRITLVSRRIERDLTAMGATKKKRSDAARIAAEARWNKERMRDGCESHAQGNADAMRGDAIPEARSQKLEIVSNDTSIAPTLDKSRSKPKTISWNPDEGFTGISEQDRNDWAEAYPACDVGRQLAAANQWLKANPAKAKKSLWRKFITSWLSRSQERGGDLASNRPSNDSHKPEMLGGRTANIIKASEIPDDPDYHEDEIPI